MNEIRKMENFQCLRPPIYWTMNKKHKQVSLKKIVLIRTKIQKKRKQRDNLYFMNQICSIRKFESHNPQATQKPRKVQ